MPRLHTTADAVLRTVTGSRAQVLRSFSGQVLQLTGASAAGISIFNSRSCDELTWESVSGNMQEFTGRRFPLRNSMCGICLEKREPQLFRWPHRYFAWMAQNGILVAEALVVPLCGVGNDVYGTVWAATDTALGTFSRQHANDMLALGAVATAALRYRSEREGGATPLESPPDERRGEPGAASTYIGESRRDRRRVHM
ncbi:MAG: hypothetical protein WKG03_02065 [Telluria sp.]